MYSLEKVLLAFSLIEMAKSQYNNGFGFNNFVAPQFGNPQYNQPVQNPVQSAPSQNSPFTNNNYGFGTFPSFGGPGTVSRGGDETQNINNGFFIQGWDNNQGIVWGSQPIQRPVTAPSTQYVFTTRPVLTTRPVSKPTRPVSTSNTNRNNGRISTQSE